MRLQAHKEETYGNPQSMWRKAASPFVTGEAKANRHLRAALHGCAVAARGDEAPVRAHGRHGGLVEHRVTRRPKDAHLAGATVGRDDDLEENDPLHAHATRGSGVGRERIHAVRDARLAERSAASAASAARLAPASGCAP